MEQSLPNREVKRVERIDLKIAGACILRPKVFTDARGFFMESYNRATLQSLGITDNFVQDNHSCSRQGTLRGLHYQRRFPQGKLCRVVVGEVLDVIVDLRIGSPSFRQWAGVVLSAQNKQQVWVPPGCAHGFSVLSETAEFLYKCTDYYHPEDECGILWNDPSLNIDWQVTAPIISNKDSKNPPLSEIDPSSLPAYRAE
jgi:dTDP-4-dehydrorhamnose 3,5-epimerase